MPPKASLSFPLTRVSRSALTSTRSGESHVALLVTHTPWNSAGTALHTAALNAIVETDNVAQMDNLALHLMFNLLLLATRIAVVKTNSRHQGIRHARRLRQLAEFRTSRSARRSSAASRHA